MSFAGWGGEVYRDHFESGIYACSKCGNELFNSAKKYEHSSPWPSFTDTVQFDSVSKRPEGPQVYKVSCAKCGNDLGHEYLNDGPGAGDSRFSIFSSSLQFKEV